MSDLKRERVEVTATADTDVDYDEGGGGGGGGGGGDDDDGCDCCDYDDGCVAGSPPSSLTTTIITGVKIILVRIPIVDRPRLSRALEAARELTLDLVEVALVGPRIGGVIACSMASGVALGSSSPAAASRPTRKSTAAPGAWRRGRAGAWASASQALSRGAKARALALPSNGLACPPKSVERRPDGRISSSMSHCGAAISGVVSSG